MSVSSGSQAGVSRTSGASGTITHLYPVANDSESTTYSSMPESQESRTQEEMKNLMMKELSCATFFVDLTNQDAIFYADSNNVQEVLDHLQQRRYNLTSNTLLGGGESSETNTRFPLGGFDMESHSCEPLTHLLNMIVRTNDSLPDTQRYLRHLRFHSDGIEIEESRGFMKALNPDGVGLVVDLPAERKVSWRQVEVVIQVKNRTSALVQQAATYARCCLVNNKRRSFAIGFDHKHLIAWFLVFHRSGLSSSRPLSLGTQQGFKDVVKHIVGMLSIRDEAGYGLDVTRSQNILSLNDRYYKIVNCLTCAIAFVVVPQSFTIWRVRSLLIPQSFAYVGARAACLDAASYSMPSQTRRLTLGNKVVALPDRMTYKVSYPVSARAQEGQLFSRFVNHFGIADVVGFHVCGPDEPHGSTQRFFHDAEFWNVFGGDDREPEKRSQQCIAMCSGGTVTVRFGGSRWDPISY